MKFTRHSVSAETNTKEFLRLISLATIKQRDLVIDKDDLLVLSTTIEMLLDSFTHPPFTHSDH